MSHHCHATGCQLHVPPTIFMCKPHWFKLPKRMRDAIWATYREGQCRDWKITHEYAEAAKEAVTYIAALEGVEPDLSIYEMLDPGEAK